MNAGETVNIAVLDTLDMTDVPAVLNLAFEAGEPVVEKNPADYFETDENGYYIIGSLESPVDIFVGNNDINYIYIAEADGVVTVTPTVEDTMTATNCWIKVNDGSYETYSEPVTVAAGDAVLINIWQGYEGTASLTVDEVVEPEEPVIVETNAMAKANYSVRLIEPWALRVNVTFHVDASTAMELSGFKSFGAYGIIGYKFENAENATVEDLINDPDAVKFEMAAEATEGCAYPTSDVQLTFDFYDDLYTYRLSDTIYWVAYYEDADGNLHFTRVRNKTLPSTMDGTVNPSETVANVFASMKDVETKILAYRGTITDFTGVYPAGVTIGESGINFAATPAAGAYKYATRHSMKLIEPWGIRVETKIVSSSNTSVAIDYAAADDYGLIFYHDKEGKYDGMSVEQMLAEAGAQVYSKTLGNTTITSDSRVCATYDQNIFTFEMDSNLYALPFVIINGQCYYRDDGAINMNLVDRLEAFAADMARPAEERAVYEAMIQLNADTKVFRGLV